MPRFGQTSASLSIILLAMSARAVTGLTCSAEPWLGLALAVSGAAILVSRSGPGPSHAFQASQVRVKPGRPAAFLVAVSVLAGALVSTPVLKLFAWRMHDIRLPGAFYQLIAWALPGSARSGGLITFWTGRGLEAVRPTCEGLGFYDIWYLAVALTLFGALTGRRLTARAALRGAAVFGAYALLRWLVVTALAVELGRPEIVWLPLYSVLSWLPLAGAVSFEHMSPVLRGKGPASEGQRAFSLSRKGIAALAAVFVLGLVIAFLLGYEDPGYLKQGRVMIDEGHADWEWADEPFDTTAYGIRAEYNYYCLREYLGHFYSLSLNSEAISAARLDTVDVLIIKTPTEAFGAGEIDAIESFVAGGGGLLLIGDHTNLFGMSTHLNEIAERFGMRFRCDDTFDIGTTGFSHYRKPWSAFHPAARAVQDFGFLTSCSIDGGMRTRAVMLGCGLGSEEADYGHPNFFGNITYELCDRFGVFLQAGAAAFGEGRVMLFSDSTCFSNFCMFGPGRCELALGMIDYLNRSGKRYPFVIHLAFALAGAMGLALAISGLRRDRNLVPACSLAAMLSMLLAGVTVGLFVVSHVNTILHGSLNRRKIDNVVLFDTGHTRASFFTYPGAPRRPGTMGFEVLYLCAQRIGAHPSTGGLDEICAIQPSGLVVINPSRSFSGENLAAVDTFLRDGGTLLLLDSIRNGASTANELLGHYGMGIIPVQGAGSTSERGRCISPRLAVLGGIELIHDDAGRARAAFVQIGGGILLVATDSFGYSHHALGSLLEKSKPAPEVRDLYSEVYALLGNLIERPDNTLQR